MNAYETELKKTFLSESLNGMRSIKTDSGKTVYLFNNRRSFGILVPTSGKDYANSFNKITVESVVVNHETDGDICGIWIYTSDDSIIDVMVVVCSDLICLYDEILFEGELSIDKWCTCWKNALGNTYTKMTVYDVLGELIVLKLMMEGGFVPVWTGPEGGRHDIRCLDRDCEVKSSIQLTRAPVVTVSNSMQLSKIPGALPVFLYYCKFEEASNGHLSINSVINEIKTQGYSLDVLERGLKAARIITSEERNRKYNLVKILVYQIDDNFPIISADSFVGGTFPPNIVNMSYSIDLTGITPERAISPEQIFHT